MKIIFLGPPCSGKGTQADILSKKMSIRWISSGVICREEIAMKSLLGNQLNDILSRGDLVPDQLINDIVYRYIQKLESYLLDGFPRTIFQAKFLQEKNIIFDHVFLFTVEKDELIRRMKNRDENRSDDNVEIFEKRLKIYQNDLSPLIDFYSKMHIIKEINGNLPIDDVASEISQSIL